MGSVSAGVGAGYTDTATPEKLSIRKTTPEAIVFAAVAAAERGEALADERSRKHRLQHGPAPPGKYAQPIWRGYRQHRFCPSTTAKRALHDE